MKTILILEDDSSLAIQWKFALETMGFHVYHETNVDAAIEVLHSKSIDLIITDMLIGNAASGFSARGGISLLSYVSLYVQPKPKIITVTGASSSLSLEKIASQLKADITVSKPITEKLLCDLVAKYLHHENANLKYRSQSSEEGEANLS